MSTTYTTTQVSGDTTLDTTATVYDCTLSNSDLTLTLPTVSTGRIYIILRSDNTNNNLYIVPANGNETIGGNNNFVLSGSGMVQLLAYQSTSNWFILNYQN